MRVSEVRIKLMNDPQDRLLAFCSITFDACFVIRDLKIIRGTKGPFVAMPSRKLTDRCPRCGGKNTLRSAFCNHCGRKLAGDRVNRGSDGRRSFMPTSHIRSILNAGSDSGESC